MKEADNFEMEVELLSMYEYGIKLKEIVKQELTLKYSRLFRILRCIEHFQQGGEYFFFGVFGFTPQQLLFQIHHSLNKLHGLNESISSNLKKTESIISNVSIRVTDVPKQRMNERYNLDMLNSDLLAHEDSLANQLMEKLKAQKISVTRQQITAIGILQVSDFFNHGDFDALKKAGCYGNKFK